VICALGVCARRCSINLASSLLILADLLLLLIGTLIAVDVVTGWGSEPWPFSLLAIPAAVLGLSSPTAAVALAVGSLQLGTDNWRQVGLRCLLPAITSVVVGVVMLVAPWAFVLAHYS
jgi:hypothetical protein